MNIVAGTFAVESSKVGSRVSCWDSSSGKSPTPPLDPSGRTLAAFRHVQAYSDELAAPGVGKRNRGATVARMDVTSQLTACVEQIEAA